MIVYEPETGGKNSIGGNEGLPTGAAGEAALVRSTRTTMGRTKVNLRWECSRPRGTTERGEEQNEAVFGRTSERARANLFPSKRAEKARSGSQTVALREGKNEG